MIQSESLEDRRLLTVLLADSFEVGEWDGVWAEDGQNDWKRSTQRESEGSYSAEVDGYASNATLSLANPIDLTTYESAELTFSWYIESGFDRGEYIALDFFDGTNWNQIASLDGNVDQENTWHNETITIDRDYLTSDFQLRFRAKVSSSREDGFVDNVKIEAAAAVLPAISINDTSVAEGDTSIEFLDAFVSAGSGGLNYPKEQAFGPDGNLYVTSGNSDSVIRYDAATGEFIDVFVPTSAGLDNPHGLLFGPDGNLYVTSRLTDEVFRFDGSTGASIDTFVAAGSGGLDNPVGLAFGEDGNLYVSSRNTDEVLRYDGATGAFIDVFVTAGSGGLDYPHGLVFGPDGNLYVTSPNRDPLEEGLVLRYDSSTGAFIDMFVTAGHDTGGVNDAVGLVFGPAGDLYVSRASGDSVLRYDGSTGAYVEDYVSSGSGGLAFPGGLLFDADGNLYVSSRNTNEVLRYGAVAQAAFTVSLSSPSAVPVTVDFSTSDGTATNGADYTAVGGTLTFAPGETSQTIIVPTFDDSGIEGDETFTVTLSNATASTIADGTGFGTIVDDDFGSAPPTANAGANQTLNDGDGGGDAVAILNGSGSDSDGTIASYQWTNGTMVLGNAASISTTLGVGTHTLTLTVTDDDGATAGDSVVVTVNPNQGPTANAGSDQIVTDGTAVTLNGSGSDGDGSVVSYQWTDGTTVLGNAASISPTLAVGAHTLTLTVTDNGGATASDTVMVTVNPVVVSSTKFYVVDPSVDDMFEYKADGTLVENYNLGSGNNAPRGVAADSTGNTVWVIDNDDHVYVHDNDGQLLRSWKANGLSRPEGIATNGVDVWIVDRGNDRVHYFAGGATRTTDTGATSSFSLVAGNPRGITTDGTHLWVVDASTDDVYKYTVGGSFVGSWALDSRNSTPSGITINPGDVNDIWVIDSTDDDIYQYSGAANRTSGSQSADAVFGLAAGNTNPQGIADPPPGDGLKLYVDTFAADDAGRFPVSALRQRTDSDLFGGKETASRRPTELPTTLSTWFGHIERDTGTELFAGPKTSEIDATLSSVDAADDVAAESTDAEFGGWLDILANDLVEMHHRK